MSILNINCINENTYTLASATANHVLRQTGDKKTSVYAAPKTDTYLHYFSSSFTWDRQTNLTDLMTQSLCRQKAKKKKTRNKSKKNIINHKTCCYFFILNNSFLVSWWIWLLFLFYRHAKHATSKDFTINHLNEISKDTSLFDCFILGSVYSLNNWNIFFLHLTLWRYFKE